MAKALVDLLDIKDASHYPTRPYSYPADKVKRRCAGHVP